MTPFRHMSAAGSLLLLVSLVGCGGGKGTASDPNAPDPKSLTPADADVALLYNNCRSCHTTSLSGAPLTGDKAAWESRVAQGMDVLLQHTIEGYKGMPALGSCADCTEDDFKALITFMAQIK